MLVEESWIFQVTTFGTLHLHRSELDQDQVLLDVMTIADEADRQLTETVHSFMMARGSLAAHCCGDTAGRRCSSAMVVSLCQ